MQTRRPIWSRVGYNRLVGRLGNRSAYKALKKVLGLGGKSGLLRAKWSITSTGRKARESATERIPPGPQGFGKGEKVG